MRNLAKLTSAGLPALAGLGVAWIGICLLKNERKLEVRRMELEIQLSAKSLTRL